MDTLLGSLLVLLGGLLLLTGTAVVVKEVFTPSTWRHETERESRLGFLVKLIDALAGLVEAFGKTLRILGDLPSPSRMVILGIVIDVVGLLVALLGVFLLTAQPGA